MRAQFFDESGRQGNGEETLGELSRRIREKSPNGHRIETFAEESLVESIHQANTLYDGNLPGEARSLRPALGPLFTVIKRLVRKLIYWYVEPALDSQRLFNAHVTRSMNEMKRYLDHLQINEDILSTIMHRDLALFRANIMYQNRFLERRLAELESELTATGDMLPAGVRHADLQPAGAGGNGDLMAELDVLALEQRVHGSPRVVKDRQSVYVGYLRGCSSVLALGCGRGELLELLAAEGVRAEGVETNSTLVNYCRDHDLDVVRADPLDHLESLDNASLEGVVLFRFAGHQPTARLMRMMKACREKLVDGGVLIVETPNPFSLYAVASYAAGDYQRVNPLHPETLKLLCLSYGFAEPKVMFLNPEPPEEHLEEIDAAASGAALEPRELELFRQVNQNFLKINRILFSHRDYALVAHRGARDEA